MGEPRVSVGLPVRNGARFLPDTLESLLGQTFGDFELVISDNASTDETEEICRSFTRQDRRVRYLRQPTNLGANENYNAVVHASRGELFRWSAHDDLTCHEYLERTVALLDARPDAVLAHSGTTLIDDDSRPLTPVGTQLAVPSGTLYDPPDPIGRDRRLDDPRPSVRLRDVLLHSAWCFEIFGVIRRPVLLTTRLQRGFYGTDKVLLAELALRGTLVHVEEPLWQRRCHSGTSTNLNLRQKVRWADPRATILVPPVARMVAGYARAPLDVPLPARERLASWRAVAGTAVQPDKFRKLLLPGPHNYLGLHRRSSAPPSALAPADD